MLGSVRLLYDDFGPRSLGGLRCEDRVYPRTGKKRERRGHHWCVASKDITAGVVVKKFLYD